MSIHRIMPVVSGRHRLGRPGLIPVTALVAVARRSLLMSWFRPGRHRRPAIRPSAAVAPVQRGLVPAAS